MTQAKQPKKYSEKEAQNRFDASLRGAFSTPPKPMRDNPRKRSKTGSNPEQSKKRRRKRSMNTVYAIFLYSVMDVTSAIAQSASPCAAITDDRSRLQCYDDAAAREQALSHVVPTPVPTHAPAPSLTRVPAPSPKHGPAPGPTHVLAPVPTHVPAVAEDIIAKAKAAVKLQLRDPGSAKFDDVETKTVAGKRVVCGGVSSTTANGEMTGQIPFAFDGDSVAIMAWEGGTANGTMFDAKELAASLHDRLDEYNTYCK